MFGLFHIYIFCLICEILTPAVPAECPFYLCGSAYLGAQEISFRDRRPNMKKILLLNITLLVTHGSTFSLASPVQTNNPGLNGPMQKMPLTLTIYKSSWSRWSWNEAGWFSKWVQPPLWCLVPIQLDGTYVHSESFLFNLWLCHFCDHFYIFSPCRQLPAVQNVLFAHQVEDDITFTNRACIVLNYAIASLKSVYRFIVYRHIPPN